MPMPFAHFALAQQIAQEAKLSITNWPNYYVGAFMPDIRYFTKQPRDKYHFDIEKLEPYFDSPLDTNDFLLGYKVHLIIDEVWEYPELKVLYKNSFPRLIRNRMTRGLQALAFEMYCLKQAIEPISIRPVSNQLTKDLDISTETIAWSVKSMQRYIDEQTLEAAYEMAIETQLFPEQRLAIVGSVVRRMRNPFIRFFVEKIVARASTKIIKEVKAKVMERLELEEQVPKPFASIAS